MQRLLAVRSCMFPSHNPRAHGHTSTLLSPKPPTDQTKSLSSQLTKTRATIPEPNPNLYVPGIVRWAKASQDRLIGNKNH